jgi:LPXTG-motif cell wall-anchored protein
MTSGYYLSWHYNLSGHDRSGYYLSWHYNLSGTTYSDPATTTTTNTADDNNGSWGWLGLLGLLGLSGLAKRKSSTPTTTYHTDDRVTTHSSPTDPRI